MSGPWDRPPREPDREWPSEDLESRSAPRDPLAPFDPPPGVTGGGAPSRDWDEWPPIAPPDEGYLFDEPLPPSSDPWAESWTDESADAVPYAAPDRPQREYEPAYRDPPVEPAWSPQPEQTWSPQPEQTWSPQPDQAWSPEPVAEPVAAESPVPAAEPEAPPAASDDAVAHSIEWEPDAPASAADGDGADAVESRADTPSPWSRPWSPDLAPDWMTEAVAEPPAPAVTEPDADAEPVAPAAEPVTDAKRADAESEPAAELAVEPVVEPAHRDVDERETEPLPPPWVPPARVEPEAAPPVESELAPPVEDEPPPDPRFLAAPAVFAPPAAPTSSDAAVEAVAADAEREAAPSVGAAPASDREAPAAADAEPEPAAAPAPVEAPPEQMEPPSIFATRDRDAVEERPDALDAAEPIAEPVPEHAPEAAPQPEPEREAEPAYQAAAEDQRDAQPERAWAATAAPGDLPAEPAPQPTPERPIESIWAHPDREHAAAADRPYTAGEPTQVFPSSWAPPPPPPRETLEPEAGEVRTSLAAGAAPAEEAAVAEQPAVAEQAVPWLIGVILLLAGMVIVLLALIFAGDASLGGRGASPSASGRGLAGVIGSGEPSASPSASASESAAPVTPAPSASASPTPEPLPEYGALELVYQGRSAALAPIYLLLHDFTIDAAPVVLAQDPNVDVRRFSWSRDGTVGTALLGDTLVSVEQGVEKRPLGDTIATSTFGMTSDTVYAVRIVQEVETDTAVVLAIDFESAEATELARVTYTRPQIAPEDALQEAQFADDGGTVRLIWMDDDTLWLWVLGAGAWRVDPESGELTEVEEVLPILWAPDRDRRAVMREEGTSTTIEVVDGDDEEVLASTTVDMVVSHLRWSRDGQRIIFTGGRLARGGGVLQDLFLWDPYEGTDPAPLTNTGAAFGGEWRGAMPVWRPPE